MTRVTFSDWLTTMAETKAIVFDLDDTLAPSKQPIPVEIAYQLTLLAPFYQLGILTGGNFKQVKTQVLDKLPAGVANKINVFSCSGSQYRLANDNLVTEMIPNEERKRIKNLVEKAAIELGLWTPTPVGDIIEDRLAQITFSALGQKASPEAKSGWDVDRSKRENLVSRLQNLVEGYDIRIGGSTSIDITPAGRDKAYGMRKFLNLVGVEPMETIYVGDSFGNSGNDFPVLSTGVFCLEVSGWEQTLGFMKWLSGEQVS